MNRTDIHRPSAIVPSDYEFVAFHYLGGSDLGATLANKAERERFEAHRARTGGVRSQHEHGGFCHICGCSNVSYAVIFYHAKSNSYIETGEDCARKLEMGFEDMNPFRKAIHSALEAVAGKKKAKALLETKGLLRCWEIYLGEGDTELFVGGYDHFEENTIRDIVGKLVKYGSISEKQEQFLDKLLKKIDERPAIEAKRKAEADAAEPCPIGRVSITGVVLSVKDHESNFGVTTKMVVKDDRGFKVWGTCPSGFNKGQRVSFSANVSPSPDDPKFGFFKRPTKSVVLEERI